MDIQCRCEQCGQLYAVNEASVGQTFVCGKCNAQVSVPDAPPAPVAVARGPNHLWLIACIASVICLFLPWLNEPPARSAGGTAGYYPGIFVPYQMTEILDHVEKQTRDETRLLEVRARARQFKWLYAIYLIPLLAIVGIMDELIAKKKARHPWFTQLTFMLFLLGVLVNSFGQLRMANYVFAYVMQPGETAGASIAWGYYVMFVPLVLAFASLFTTPAAHVDEWKQRAARKRSTVIPPVQPRGKVEHQ